MVLYFDKVPSKPQEDTGLYAAILGNGSIKWDDLEAGVPFVSVYYGNTWVARKGREYILSGVDLDSSSNDGFPINQRNNMVGADVAGDINNNSIRFVKFFKNLDTFPVDEAQGSVGADNIGNGQNTVGFTCNHTDEYDNITSFYLYMSASLSGYTYLYTTNLYYQYGTCGQYGTFYKVRYEGVVVADVDAATFDYYSLTEAQRYEQTIVVEAYLLTDGTKAYIVPIQMPMTGEVSVLFKPIDSNSEVTVTGISASNMTSAKVIDKNGSSTASLTRGNASGILMGGNYTYPMSGCHTIDECYSTRFAKDDITITGVRVVVDRQVEVSGSTEEQTVVFTTGSSDYMIQISDNPLIPTTSDADAQFIADYLGAVLIGTTFRTAQLTHSSDPTIEGGDVALAIDRKGRAHPILVTSTTFSSSAAQNTQCSAESVSDNRANRKTASESLYDKVIDMVNKLIAANQGSGLADYVVAKGTSGNWYYQHWNSGRKEAWFNGSVSSGSTWTASGNAYRATWSQSIPSAVGFDSTPHVLISIAQNTSAIYAITGYASSKTATSGYFFRGQSASSSSSVTISIYAWTN